MIKKKLHILILMLALGVSLAIYFLLRIGAAKYADIAADNFFAEFSTTTDHARLKNRIHLVGQDFSDALAIMERNKSAITTFDYKHTAPSLNLMLNEANVPVSWHLTIFLRKEGSAWYVSRFQE